jgi:hypothetical protein
MDGPIVSRESIQARAAAAAAFDGIPPTNPYPPGTAAHDLFESEFSAALVVIEAVPV